ncbi:hypothetical protein BHM03_00036020, partial [Ensete ventricosum]
VIVVRILSIPHLKCDLWPVLLPGAFFHDGLGVSLSFHRDVPTKHQFTNDDINLLKPAPGGSRRVLGASSWFLYMGHLVVLTLPCHQRLGGSVLVGTLEHLRHDRRWPFDHSRWLIGAGGTSKVSCLGGVVWLWMALCPVGSYLGLAYRYQNRDARHSCCNSAVTPSSSSSSLLSSHFFFPCSCRRTPSSSPVLAAGQRHLCCCPISPALAASRHRLNHCPVPRPPHLSGAALSSSPLAATSADAPARSNFLAGVHPCLNTCYCRPLLLHRRTAVPPLLPAAAAHSCLCRLPLLPPIYCLQPHPVDHLFHLSSFPCISTTTAAPPAHSPLLSPLLLPPASAAASLALSRNHRWALLTLTPQPPPSPAAATLTGLPLTSPSSLAFSSDLATAALAGPSLPPFLPYATTASIATTARPFHP